MSAYSSIPDHELARSCLKSISGRTFALNSNKLQEEAMSGEDHADTSPYLPVRRPDAIVRAVTVSEIIEALADGLRDFQSAPGGG
jgi:hypothetical protein